MSLIIGITHSYEDNFAKLNIDYLKITAFFGATGLIIPYTEKVSEILDITDGVILSGGGDLSERLISERLSPMAKNIYPDRDIFEAELCAEAYKRDIPLLGICRGVQVMNAALGGTIYQHIDGHISEYADLKNKDETVTHGIKINKESFLYKITESEHWNVNSFHHQCVKIPAPGFMVSAEGGDFNIEAIENPEKRFFAGVQWHPEKTPDDKLSRGIFQNFIEACKK